MQAFLLVQPSGPSGRAGWRPSCLVDGEEHAGGDLQPVVRRPQRPQRLRQRVRPLARCLEKDVEEPRTPGRAARGRHLARLGDEAQRGLHGRQLQRVPRVVDRLQDLLGALAAQKVPRAARQDVAEGAGGEPVTPLGFVERDGHQVHLPLDLGLPLPGAAARGVHGVDPAPDLAPEGDEVWRLPGRADHADRRPSPLEPFEHHVDGDQVLDDVDPQTDGEVLERLDGRPVDAGLAALTEPLVAGVEAVAVKERRQRTHTAIHQRYLVVFRSEEGARRHHGQPCARGETRFIARPCALRQCRWSARLPAAGP